MGKSSSLESEDGGGKEHTEEGKKESLWPTLMPGRFGV